MYERTDYANKNHTLVAFSYRETKCKSHRARLTLRNSATQSAVMNAEG